MVQEYVGGDFLIGTDPSKLDVAAIRACVSHAHCAERMPREIVARSIQHSLCFAVYDSRLAPA